MKWPNKPMSPETAQKLIDALEEVQHNSGHWPAVNRALNDVKDAAQGDESQAHYQPLNITPEETYKRWCKNQKEFGNPLKDALLSTETPKALYDGKWKPEVTERWLLNHATGEKTLLPPAFASIEQIVDKLVKRVEMLESMQMGLKRYQEIPNSKFGDPND